MANLKLILLFLLFFASIFFFSFKNETSSNYLDFYQSQIKSFYESQSNLVVLVKSNSFQNNQDTKYILDQIGITRKKLKSVDFWLRYLEPLAYKKINGPLPIEWETEVFEKFEKPYKRIGAGLTLAELYLEESDFKKDSLLFLLEESQKATQIFQHDSITRKLNNYDHFYLCNRLFLLNLASIYTTGFDCPDTNNVVPELKFMLAEVGILYTAFNQSYPNQALTNEYLQLYQQTLSFVNNQPLQYSHFNHFQFIRDFVNPLFKINQKFILNYKVSSRSNLDYALNKKAISIFDKELYEGQNTKGIFLRVKDEAAIAEIQRLGKLLFYDPILSANNKRSCASCHIPQQFFTDTLRTTALQFNQKDELRRNTPSLINAPYNHLAMLDGKHFTLQHQGIAVITNKQEMGSDSIEVLEKILSCKEYKSGFTKLLKYTPQVKEITLEHIVSAITIYYGKFSKYDSPFDDALNHKQETEKAVIKGFNLFMSKAQCGTCHFVPQFNGVKPPFIGSEFEVLGTPQDSKYKKISTDLGRYEVNPAVETKNAFRTGSLRNIVHTSPYMHNGVFKTLDEVIEFYNGGGGVGHGFQLENQTLSADSLHLTKEEKTNLIAFMNALTEKIPFEAQPSKLPISKQANLNTRKVGGEF